MRGKNSIMNKENRINNSIQRSSIKKSSIRNSSIQNILSSNVDISLKKTDNESDDEFDAFDDLSLENLNLDKDTTSYSKN